MNEHAEWLRAELPVLLREGVIDAATAERLGRRYAAAEVPAGSVVGEAVEVIRASAGQPLSRALVICAVLGAGLIGLGLIQIIAHDWDQWTKPQRLALAFGPLLALQALGAWVLRARATSRAWGEGVATALALAGAGALALVGQIYHFPGELDAYALAVALLALPLVYVFDSAAVAALVLLGYTGWLLLMTGLPWLPLRYLALLATLAPFGWQLLRGGGRSWRANLLASVLAGCLAAAVTISSFGGDARLLLRLALLVSIFALAASLVTPDGRGPLWRYGRHGGALLVLAATWRELWSGGHAFARNGFDEFGLHGWLPIEALAWLALLVLALRRRLAMSAEWWLLAALPVAFWIGTQIALGGARETAALLFDGYALALGIATIRIGLAANELAALNRGLAIVSALVLMRFFDSNLPFLVRGFAFMAVGAAFLGANIWLRRRQA